MDTIAAPRHRITRVRHEIRRRKLTVASIERPTPHMLWIGFTSPDLRDFPSVSFDDHVKLLLPDAGAEDRPVMRDFTPRRFDVRRGTLVIDFALHEAGPAIAWAASAKIGDTIMIGGPKGSTVVPDDFDWYLLIGDETAIPAMGRRVEELRPGVPVATFAVIADAAEAQIFESRAALNQFWIPRDGADDDAARLRGVLADYRLPAGDGFVWIAAEASVARDLRHLIVNERNHPKEWTKAAGYWSRGEAGADKVVVD
jgi:NADPH-dependent ferric siderophore reductase